jgi:biotin synthase
LATIKYIADGLTLFKNLKREHQMIPEKIRVSAGSAALLGLDKYWLDVKPTTAYLMTYTDGRCSANCSFCPQARESHANNALLSRVLWPVYSVDNVLCGLKNSDDSLERVCIQTVNVPGFFEETLALLKAIRYVKNIPVSIDTSPLAREQMEKLYNAGLDKIGIPLDIATENLFERVKGKYVNGPYRWETHFEALNKAVEVFGKGRVLSNIIIGLGETESQSVEIIQLLFDNGVETSLFAFTPVAGTKLSRKPQPSLASYRRLQMARYLITQELVCSDEMKFDNDGTIVEFGVDRETILKIVKEGKVFQTSGCPGCNRPYYNERPSGPLYNYPRMLTAAEVEKEAKLLEL